MDRLDDPMIGTVLQFVTRQMNLFICNRLRIDTIQDRIVLASHVSPDGTFGGQQENVLLLCLIGIRKDTIAKHPRTFPEAALPTGARTSGPAFVKRPPPVHLNLQLLIAANYRSEQIRSGLDMLSLAILMLQANPLWDARRFPGLPDEVGDLAFEMETLNYQEQSHLWGAVGAKYMPSVVYKLRMLTFDDGGIESLVPAVRTVASQGTGT